MPIPTKSLRNEPRTLAIHLAAAAALSAAALGAQSHAWTNLGQGTAGCCGVPALGGSTPRFGRTLHLSLASAATNAPAWFVLGLHRIDVPILGGVLVPSPDLPPFALATSGSSAHLRLRIPRLCGTPPARVWAQALIADGAAPQGFAFSNAITAVVRHDVPSDFNGDGYSDLAIGVPDEDVGSATNAGAINVVYGSAAGLVAATSQLIRQGDDVNGTILNTPEADDEFGTALAVGDFDGDGFDDLAIGVPREDSTGPVVTDTGIVMVLYGSAQGLQGGSAGRDDQLFRQGLNGLAETAEAFDYFGKALCAGDFDGDGYADLAVGAPYEDRTAFAQGVVHVLFGSANGLTTLGNLLLEEPHTVEQDDRFGWVLQAGDFDSDGRDDIAVGRPYQDVSNLQDAGAVSVLYMGGRFVARSRDIHKNTLLSGTRIVDTPAQFDLFGFALAVGDFNHDGVDDLAAGVPFEDLNGGTVSAAGTVHVIYGAIDDGLVGAGNQQWHQDSAGVNGVAELGDRFGYALAAGDFDDDGDADLAIGVTGEHVNGVTAGAVHFLRGAVGGITADQDRLWTQPGLGLGSVTAQDDFGWALFAGRFDAGCGHDLAIGIPGATVGSDAGAGAVAIRYQGPAGHALFTQVELRGAPQADDHFGAALACSPDQRPL